MSENIPEGAPLPIAPETTPEKRKSPDYGMFIGLIGIFFAVFIPNLQMNGIEINWQFSALDYLAIIVGFVWTFLIHASPHRGKIFRITGSLTLVIALGWIATIATLRQYDTQHPKTPMITVTAETMRGLPEGMTNDPSLRYHILTIRNDNDIEIDNFVSRLQMPEPIETTVETNLSPGISIEWKPILTRFTVVGTGNHKILGSQSSLNVEWPPVFWMPLDNSAQLSRFSDTSDKTGVWELLIDKLPPHGEVVLSFLTTDNGDATNYISLVNYEFKTNGASVSIISAGDGKGGVRLIDMTFAMIVHANKTVKPNEDWRLGTNELRFSLDGWYEYKTADKLQKLHFLVPFIFDAKNRNVSSLPAQNEVGKWRLVMIEYQ
jgi:hypothetical protein